jgi:hypothetical protein
LLQAYFDSEILDTSGVPSPRILRVEDPFDVRFRIELAGPAWQCMAGDWYFDMRFDEQGGPADFKLSSSCTGSPHAPFRIRCMRSPPPSGCTAAISPPR